MTRTIYLHRAELAAAQGDLAICEFLLEPGLVEPVGGQRLDIAHGHEIAEERAGEARAMDLVGVGVGGGAAPSRRLFKIRIDHKLEAATVGRASARAAARIAKGVADIIQLKLDAPVPERAAQPAGIGEHVLAEYYILRVPALRELELDEEQMAEWVTVMFHRALFLENPPPARLRHAAKLAEMRRPRRDVLEAET
jgi:hypothetical protein